MLSILTLGGVLLTCAWTDLRHRKIYNSITYPAALFGILLNAFCSLGANPPQNTGLYLSLSNWFGAIGFAQSLIGGGICFVLLLRVYLNGGAGGGDVKLAAVLGVFLGVPSAIYVLMLSVVVAAAFLLPSRIWNLGWRGMWESEADSKSAGLANPRFSVPLGAFYAAAYVLLLGFNRCL
jgi:Flp pilus assembly protein protease CpaA